MSITNTTKSYVLSAGLPSGSAAGQSVKSGVPIEKIMLGLKMTTEKEKIDSDMPKEIKGFKEYQEEAHKTAIYPEAKALEYLTIGLAGEVGEFANKVKKTIRDDHELLFEDAVNELGDVLWYLTELSRYVAPQISNSLGYIAYRNIEKLKDRAQRDKIKGSGDNR